MAKSWWHKPVVVNDPVLVSDQEEAPLAYLERAWEVRTDNQIAEVLSGAVGRRVTPNMVALQRKAQGWFKDHQGVPLCVKESPFPRYDNPPVVEGDTVVLADTHIPFHDAAWCNKVLALARKWEIPTLIIAGDFIDFEAFSPFAPLMSIMSDAERQEQAKAEDEFRAAEQFFEATSDFERVVHLLGNHEERLARILRVELSPIRLLRLYCQQSNVEITAFYQCLVQSGGREYTVCHPRNVSVIPTRVAQFLIHRKFRRPTVTAHTHLWGIVQDDSGQDVAIDIGVGADPARLKYIQVKPNTRPAVSQGALILRRGYPWLLSPKWTDFEALLQIQ